MKNIYIQRFMYNFLVLHTVGLIYTQWWWDISGGGWKGNQKWDCSSENVDMFWPDMLKNRQFNTRSQTLLIYLQRSEVTENQCLIPVKPKYTLIYIFKRFSMCWFWRKCLQLFPVFHRTNILNSRREIIAESWLVYIHITAAAWVIKHS